MHTAISTWQSEKHKYCHDNQSEKYKYCHDRKAQVLSWQCQKSTSTVMSITKAQNNTINAYINTKAFQGAGIAQWLEHRTRDWKVAGSNPCWNGGRTFFSRVDFLCWLLFRYPFHPCFTTVARKKSRSFCQKCRWQVTAKHAYTYVDFIEPCFGIGHNLSLICQMTSEDIKHQLIIIKAFHTQPPIIWLHTNTYTLTPHAYTRTYTHTLRHIPHTCTMCTHTHTHPQYHT